MKDALILELCPHPVSIGHLSRGTVQLKFPNVTRLCYPIKSRRHFFESKFMRVQFPRLQSIADKELLRDARTQVAIESKRRNCTEVVLPISKLLQSFPETTQWHSPHGSMAHVLHGHAEIHASIILRHQLLHVAAVKKAMQNRAPCCFGKPRHQSLGNLRQKACCQTSKNFDVFMDVIRIVSSPQPLIKFYNQNCEKDIDIIAETSDVLNAQMITSAR